eukprot:TRINITY_DN29988_c0_g1_i1.p1 TRINITY_DN29988_c0_g1~~TRINITY_DN29988_c0_g1_i1.p1  ORF type:complete len:482 (+),score=189.29 TRINITY_DN29988_c0_g1_i1:90-1535(+)
MVRFLLTCNALAVLKKTVKQLTGELGVPEGDVELLFAEHRVVVTGAAQLGEDVLPSVRHCERCLVEVATVTPPVGCWEDLAKLTEVVREVDFTAALEVWEAIHHKKVGSWSLETRLRKKAGSTSPLHTGSKSAMQVAIREGLRTALTEKHGAALNFKTPDVMIQASLSEGAVIIAIPLLNKRGEVVAAQRVAKGLHHAVAWGVARTAALKPGEVVADFCVGKASLLLEAAQWWPGCVFVGSDLCPEQLGYAKGNVDLTPFGGRVGLFRSDACRLPHRSGAVDVLISDLPFGRMWGTAEDNAALYPRLLGEAARVLRGGGRAVLLTGEESAGHMTEALAATDGLDLAGTIPFKFGGNNHTLTCVLFCLVRTGHAADADAAAGTPGAKRSAASDADASHKKLKQEDGSGVAAPASRALFDWRYAEKLRANEKHSWRNEKPTMVPYRAKAFVGAPPKTKKKRPTPTPPVAHPVPDDPPAPVQAE